MKTILTIASKKLFTQSVCSKTFKLSLYSFSTKHSEKDLQEMQTQQEQEERLVSQYIKEREKNYEIVDKKYEEVSVPGKQTRKYTGLSRLQQEVVSSNSFDLQHPGIHPKSAGVNRYQGIEEELVEINLGNVKIKGENEVYLSEVDPLEIPEDLDILFDSQKQLKIVGRNQEAKSRESDERTEKARVMEIQQETVESKSIQQTLKEEFGVAISDAKYSRRERARYLASAVFLVFLFWPLVDTLRELYECLSMTAEIQSEKMAEVTRIKENNFRRVLLINGGIIKQ